jgi:hypothetical protein
MLSFFSVLQKDKENGQIPYGLQFLWFYELFRLLVVGWLYGFFSLSLPG